MFGVLGGGGVKQKEKRKRRLREGRRRSLIKKTIDAGQRCIVFFSLVTFRRFQAAFQQNNARVDQAGPSGLRRDARG